MHLGSPERGSHVSMGPPIKGNCSQTQTPPSPGRKYCTRWKGMGRSIRAVITQRVQWQCSHCRPCDALQREFMVSWFLLQRDSRKCSSCLARCGLESPGCGLGVAQVGAGSRPGVGWAPAAAAAAAEAPLDTDVEADAQGGGICLETPAKVLPCSAILSC